MVALKYLFSILTIVSVASGVKVSMQGSFNLGKGILKSISQYMRSNGLSVNLRRSGSGDLVLDNDSEMLKWAVESANVGRGLPICNGTKGDLMNEYIFTLANELRKIFEGILIQEEELNESILLEYLKPFLNDIHEILKDANAKILEDEKSIEWVTVIKKTCARCQKTAIGFIEERLEDDPQDTSNIKRKLVQKIVISTVMVEAKYENKLCKEHRICENHLVTSSLKSILGDFKTMENERAREFVKYFYENIAEKSCYFLSKDTLHELQVVLSDLSYTKNAPAKIILLSVQYAMEAKTKEYDHLLINAILSDMDYFFHGPNTSYTFVKFLDQFAVWHKNGGRFSPQMRSIMKSITEKLKGQSPVLLEKMTEEMRVFLELTIDPEK